MSKIKWSFLLAYILMTFFSSRSLIAAEWLTYSGVTHSSRGEFRYHINFRSEDWHYAERVNEVLENYSESIFEYFEYVPRWAVHFNVLEATTANGSAQVFPRNIVNLYHFPPSSHTHLHAIDDWIKGLIIHELIHIVHLEQTGGVTAFIERIFGSVGRLGGVIPLWFAEGIAVWGETYFSEGGRLSSKAMLFEIYGRLSDPLFCSSIDCLDWPEGYPGRQWAYWMGALFMEHVEVNHPGAIRCLIKQNARQIPFFLNRAFRKCHLDNAATLFSRFRSNLKRDLDLKFAEFKEDRDFQESVSKFHLPAFDSVKRRRGEGVISLQHGSLIFELGKEKFFYLYPFVRERDYYLRAQSLKSAFYFEAKLPGRLDHLASQTPFMASSKKILFSILSFDIRGEKKLWFEADLNEGDITKFNRLDFLDQALYAFQWSENLYYALYFIEDRWRLKKVLPSGEKQEIYRWSPLIQISEVSLEGDDGATILSFKKSFFNSASSEDASFMHSFKKLNLETLQEENVLKSKENFKFIGSCGQTQFFATTEGERLYLSRPLETRVDSSHREVMTYEIPLLARLADAQINKGQIIFYHLSDPLSFYRADLSCDVVLNELTLEITERKVFPRYIAREGQVDNTSTADFIKGAKDYQRPSHFLPTFWLFGFSQVAGLDTYEVTTTLSDPLLKHQLDVNATYYRGSQSKSDVGGGLSYSYNWFETRFSFGFGRSYYQSSFIFDDLDKETITYASFQRLWDLGSNHLLIPEIGLSYSQTQDFLSDRKTQMATVGGSYRRSPFLYNTFWQDTVLRLRARKVDVRQRESFFGYLVNLRQGMRPTRNWHLQTRGSYAKYLAKSRRSGSFFGGGFESGGGSVDFPFYGVRYADLFGKEMATLRLESSHVIARPYSAGGGLLPFYLKETSLLVGVDGAYSDRAFLDDRFLRHRIIHSQYAGLRLDMNLFYIAPALIDIIFARVADPSKFRETAQSEFLISVQAPFF